jgi:penicillin-binding protein 1A
LKPTTSSLPDGPRARSPRTPIPLGPTLVVSEPKPEPPTAPEPLQEPTLKIIPSPVAEVLRPIPQPRAFKVWNSSEWEARLVPIDSGFELYPQTEAVEAQQADLEAGPRISPEPVSETENKVEAKPEPESEPEPELEPVAEFIEPTPYPRSYKMWTPSQWESRFQPIDSGFELYPEPKRPRADIAQAGPVEQPQTTAWRPYKPKVVAEAVPEAIIEPEVVHRSTLWALLTVAVLFGIVTGLLLVYSVDLPQIEDLERYRPIDSTELMDVHGKVVGSFAMQRRVVVSYNDFAPVLRQAVISVEDKSFEDHWGVNSFRMVGAVVRDLASGSRSQGASTITMQLARNLFLSSDRTFSRKIQEILLSMQIEHHFTKPQIFTLYGNQIYLGHGMYGFEAASQYYFGKHASELNLTEAALLAGIPKSPSNYSPVLNPAHALKRRNLVLTEMEHDHILTAEQAEQARNAPLGLHLTAVTNTEAPWFVEEIRRTLEKQYGSEQVHEGGLRVYTGMDLALQQAAARAVARGLNEYEHRHGWRGHLLNVTAAGGNINTFQHPDWAMPVHAGEYVHALVTFVLPGQVSLKIGDRPASINPEGWKWTGNKSAKDFLKQGDIVYVHIPEAAQRAAIWQVELEQDSGAQAALFAMDNATGDVLAMVGGRDFQLSQFNRATQAARQTGSSFKPYVYTAAIEDGVRPEDRVEDTPVTFETAGGPYTPHNYDDKYLGAMSVLAAFADSRNIPALRLAARVGIRKVIAVARRFGITGTIPAYLPVALGSADVTLQQQVAAYSVFPNGGMLISPRMVRRVTTPEGRVLQDDNPDVKDATSQQTAQTMLALLREVVTGGTAASAAQLKHPLGGKTGTTNDFTDAWFVGFSPSVTAGVWVGYDDRESLGEKETGAKAALPIWIDFMRAVVAAHPGEQFAVPTKPAPSLITPATGVQDAGKKLTAKSSPSIAPQATPTNSPQTKPAL